MDVELCVNGHAHRLSMDVRTVLLDALRDRLGLTGTKKGWNQGQCGAGTVLIGGDRVLSCLVLAAAYCLRSEAGQRGGVRGIPRPPARSRWASRHCKPGERRSS